MSTADQLAVASLQGHAMHCVLKRRPVDEAVTGLREITDRADLLAHAAGIMAGAARRQADRPWYIAAARLLVEAGADPQLLPQWIARGRDNAMRAANGSEWPDDLDEVLAEVLDG